MATFDVWDNKHTCSRCQAMAHDVIRDERTYAVLECCFCGQMDRVAPLMRDVRPTPKADPEFRMPTGRFVGKTLAEVDAEPRGREYLEFVRKTNEALRPAIEVYLFAHT